VPPGKEGLRKRERKIKGRGGVSKENAERKNQKGLTWLSKKVGDGVGYRKKGRNGEKKGQGEFKTHRGKNSIRKKREGKVPRRGGKW